MITSTFKKNKWVLLGFMTFLLMAACKNEKKTMDSQVEASQEVPLTLAEQVEAIMEMWPGTYNNDAQIADIETKGEEVWRLDDSGENGYLQLQSHYIKLDKPQIGAEVLYVEEYRDHTPDATYRQRIYTISVVDSTIRVKMWPFKDKKKYIGAWNNVSLLDSLTTEELTAFPDICDLLVTKVDDTYEMKMNGKDCTFGTKTFNYGVVLSSNVFAYRDKITDKETDSIISTAANFAYHKLDRIGD